MTPHNMHATAAGLREAMSRGSVEGASGSADEVVPLSYPNHRDRAESTA